MSRFAVTSDWVGNAIVSNQQQTSALAEKVAVPKRQPSAEDPTTVLGGPKGYHHSAQPSMGDDCSSSSDTVPSEAALQLAPPVCTAAATGPIIRSDSSFSSTTSSVRSAGEPSSSNSEAAAPLGKDTHYSRHAVSSYITLPRALRPFLLFPGLRHFTVVAHPTFSPSGGFVRMSAGDAEASGSGSGDDSAMGPLPGYKAVIPKRERRRSQLLVVVDKPGLTAGGASPDPTDKKHHWVEFELPRNYYIDLSGVSSFEQFVERLPKNKRRNYRQRQEAWQRLAASSLTLAYEPLPLGQTELVEQLWMLYRANAQRNGLCVTNERRFKRVHLNTPGLSIATIRDASQGGRIVCFATGFRSGDALISAWCGTDYDHPLARSCYFYIMTQYEMLRVAIADPAIRRLDLGAQHGTMKRGIGATSFPVAGYMRCRNASMASAIDFFMRRFFNQSAHLVDP